MCLESDCNHRALHLSESLWDRNYGRQGLEVSAETSVGEDKDKEQVTTDVFVLAADNGYGTRAGGREGGWVGGWVGV